MIEWWINERLQDECKPVDNVENEEKNRKTLQKKLVNPGKLEKLYTGCPNEHGNSVTNSISFFFNNSLI